MAEEVLATVQRKPTLFFMTWVKICGTTNLEDALVAVEAGADAVGFVFYEKSPRCVTVEAAGEIIAKLPGSIEKIGVFVNEPLSRVEGIADRAGLTAVQYHGDEYRTPSQYASERRAVFCLPVTDMLHELRGRSGLYGLPEFPKHSSVLLDSGNQEQRGGTGKTFAWGEAYGFVSVLKKLHHVIIAGGLSASNVGWAVDLLRPWGVDVASGVESQPGKKDPEKVRAFVRAVRDVDRRVS
jgi:phosphoribosylanthranilate isomerase